MICGLPPVDRSDLGRCRLDRGEVGRARCRPGVASCVAAIASMSPSARVVGARAATAADSGLLGDDPAFALRGPAAAASRSASRGRGDETRSSPASRLRDQLGEARGKCRIDRARRRRAGDRNARIDRFGGARRERRRRRRRRRAAGSRERQAMQSKDRMESSSGGVRSPARSQRRAAAPAKGCAVVTMPLCRPRSARP